MRTTLKEVRKRKGIGKVQKKTTKNHPRQLSRHFSKKECKKDNNVSTPSSAKKRSPPSTTKPQPKRMNLHETDMEDSETDSSTDEDTTPEHDPKKMKSVSALN